MIYGWNDKIKKLKKYIITFLLTIIAGVIIVMGLFSFFQEKLIFEPKKLPSNFRFQFDIPFTERYFYPEKGVSINALHFKTGNSRGVILYNHGNAGNLENWGLASLPYAEMGYDFLIYDFRTYGKSTGKISEQALFDDAQFIYDEMKKEYGEKNITVFGRSIGTGIAAYLASENDPRRVILESPHYSMLDLARHYYPWMPAFLIRYEFRTDIYLQKAECPVYLIHGTDDKIIYYGSSLKLKELLGDKAELITIEGGGHDHLGSFEEYRIRMKAILE